MINTSVANVSAAFDEVASPTEAASEKLYPISFRVTADERSKIRNNAQGRSVSAYLREVSVKGKVSGRKVDAAIKVELAAKILGALGHSELLQNLSAIADAAETGSLDLSDETEAEIRAACAVIIAMRADLIEAVGIKDRE